MSLPKYACLICEHDFKSPSHLKRHQDKKKQCVKKEVQQDTTQIITDKKDINENINTKFLSDIINKEKERNSSIVIDLFKDQLTNDGNFRNQITTDDSFKALLLAILNDSNEREKEKQLAIANKIICNDCNQEFRYYQSLDKHKRLNRCKAIKQQQNNTAITTNNVIQTINITNTINLNNANIQLILNVNPIGCEKLDHISVNDFKSIFTNIDTILDKLCYHIFNRHIPNISFYKNNLNKQLVSYLTMNMEIKKIDESEFIVYLKNLLQDLCIQLFFIFKDQIPKKELLKYMQNLVEHQNQLYNNDDHFDKKFKSRITALMDDAFRKKDIRIAIENLVDNINQNITQKTQLINSNKEHVMKKNKMIKEFYSTKPISTADNNELSLVKLKNEAIELNKQYDKKILEQSQNMLRDALANITLN